MTLAPLTLHVSPRAARRLNFLVLAPLALASLVAVGLFAVLPPGRAVPLPFGDGRVTSGLALTATIGGIVTALLAIATLALRANARRLARAPWLVADERELQLPQHGLRLPWSAVTAIAPGGGSFPAPRVHLLLRPGFGRRELAAHMAASGRTGWRARLAALNVPVVEDRRMGVSYIPLVPTLVEATPAELAAALDRYRQAAMRGAPAA